MERNIFDAAAKKLSKRSKRAAQESTSASKEKRSGHVSEADDMVRRMQEMQQDLDKKMAELRKNGKLYNIDVDLYIDNLKNHYPNEMKKVSQAQKELIDAIDAIFSPETCIKRNPKTKDQLTLERKGKTLGVRKKWIPMP